MNMKKPLKYKNTQGRRAGRKTVTLPSRSRYITPTRKVVISESTYRLYQRVDSEIKKQQKKQKLHDSTRLKMRWLIKLLGIVQNLYYKTFR